VHFYDEITVENVGTTIPLREWVTIIELFFTSFQVRFLRNLDNEINLLFFYYVPGRTYHVGRTTL
jgi:hypothetical protein